MLAHIKVGLLAALVLAFSLSGKESNHISGELKHRVQKTVDDFTISEEMQRRAGQLKAVTESETFKEKQKQYETRVKSLLSGEAVQFADMKDKQPAVSHDRLILFISSSMPQTTLRRYAWAMEQVGGLMVLRGTVGDPHKLQPTVRFMEHILKKDALCTPPDCDYLRTHVTIDPRLFTRNGIKQVPALVFVENMDMANYIDKKEGDGMPENTPYVVYGDASLKGLASELHRLSKNKRLFELIQHM